MTFSLRRVLIATLAAFTSATLLAGSATSHLLTRPTEAAPFDYVVGPGEIVILDTSTQLLTDKFGQTKVFERGRFHFSSFEVKPGGMVLGQGPNPLRFYVESYVAIAGTIRVSGKDGQDLTQQFSPGSSPVPGGWAVCGGGAGGTANPGPVSLSVKGGTGLGPWAVPDAGGTGGESSLIAISPVGTFCNEPEDRHAAGGGGGSHLTQGEPGFDGTNGPYSGHGACFVLDGVSAADPTHRPFGGQAPLPIVSTTDVADDFTGARVALTGAAGPGSTTTLLVPAGAPFSPSDAGSYIGLYRAEGSWEDGQNGCLTNPGSSLLCPRSKYLLRRIKSVSPTGAAILTPALPKAIVEGDLYTLHTFGQVTFGELDAVKPGMGGGAGGNAIAAAVLPPLASSVGAKGAPGGGGGGILEIFCVGPVSLRGATLTASGGHGAGGTSALGTDYVSGGSGGGSGGFIRVESLTFVNAQYCQLLARGGSRGVGAFNSSNDPILGPPSNPYGLGHGGRGGKGLVQIHAPLDEFGAPRVLFVDSQLDTTRFDPMPILCVPSFTADAFP